MFFSQTSHNKMLYRTRRSSARRFWLTEEERTRPQESRLAGWLNIIRYNGCDAVTKITSKLMSVLRPLIGRWWSLRFPNNNKLNCSTMVTLRPLLRLGRHGLGRRAPILGRTTRHYAAVLPVMQSRVLVLNGLNNNGRCFSSSSDETCTTKWPVVLSFLPK